MRNKLIKFLLWLVDLLEESRYHKVRCDGGIEDLTSDREIDA